MVFVVLDREGPGSRRVTMTPRAIRRLQDLRRELLSQPLGPVASDVVTPAVGSQRSPRAEPLHREWDATPVCHRLGRHGRLRSELLRVKDEPESVPAGGPSGGFEQDGRTITGIVSQLTDIKLVCRHPCQCSRGRRR